MEDCCLTGLVDVEVGEMDAPVGELLWPQVEGAAGEPHQPVTVQVDPQRIQARQ